VSGEDLYITGIQGEPYRLGGAHDDGRAVDIRTRGLKYVKNLVAFLKAHSSYEVLHGDPAHMDHVHVHVKKGYRTINDPSKVDPWQSSEGFRIADMRKKLKDS